MGGLGTVGGIEGVLLFQWTSGSLRRMDGIRDHKGRKGSGIWVAFFNGWGGFMIVVPRCKRKLVSIHEVGEFHE